MINLDAMSISDLEKAADNLWRLHKYAVAKRTAMQKRLNGEIGDALKEEARCESFYTELDPEFRW